MTPHRNRRTNIHIWLLCLIGFIIFLACSCGSPRRGCYGTRNFSGYGLKKETSERIKKLIDRYKGSWVRCNETGLVCIFNPEGKLIVYYHECN